MHTSEKDHGEELKVYTKALVKAVKSNFKTEVEAAEVFFPPDHGDDNQHWYTYKPTEEEIIKYGGYWAAFKQTTSAPHYAAEINVSGKHVWDFAQEQVERGRRLFIGGWSQGGALAWELAAWYKDHVAGVMFFSSVPLAQQLDRSWWAADIPTVLTYGSNEDYFGPREQWCAAAEHLDAEFLPFTGRHCRESPILMYITVELLKKRADQLASRNEPSLKKMRWSVTNE